MLRLRFQNLFVIGLFAFCGSMEFVQAGAVKVSPSKVDLQRPEGTQQIVVYDTDSTGRVLDITRKVSLHIDPPNIAVVDERGLISPLENGTGTIVIQATAERTTIPITVRLLDNPVPISFRREIIPILTKAGCNSGGCHGKAEGQNGFKLSIFGYDAQADFEALVLEGRGRRISAAAPARSLLFLKASARTPHGGGQRIEPGSYRDHRLLRWIAEGARFDAVDDPASEIVGIEIEPQQQILLGGETQQIQVSTIDASGNRRCVTNETEFVSNAASIADVDSRGLIEASEIPGEAAILVRHLGHVATCRITVPRLGVKFARPPENNFIDTLAWNKLERLGIEPSTLSDDATFLRRVSLDTIGTLPTPAEVRQFLHDSSPDKRSRLIDGLLERDEYVDYWTMKWLNILRADQLTISPQGAVAMQRWLRHGFTQNRPFNEFATDLLTVQGNTSAEGPGSFYKILNKPDEAARSISQLLLGVRIECAQCHHHPSERWSQADYVALAGFFTGLTLKKLPNGEQAVVSFGGNDLPHPRSGELVPTRALGAAPADFTQVLDRRQVLADWLTVGQNPFFATAIANRLWAHYFGRGLIEPIDDIRETNPATNPALIEALANHMRDVKYDLKAFTRTLLNSRVYQLSATSLPSNIDDQQNFSHFIQKSQPAEVLLDAISQSTGVPEEFNGWPKGYRAIQIWDNHMPSYFFRIFGRPVRATVCECERSNEPSIAQALHLLNAPEISEKISHRHGHVRKLAASEMSPAALIEELYLSTLSRLPTSAEQELMLLAFSETDRRAAAEDVLWALLNSKEFVFNH
ncbi:MAG: DUF1549 domain-containing protein [Planctomycetota bacterium]|nr:MAG: DUF1549 domain-containing protein [Planctomycetota bacterium]